MILKEKDIYPELRPDDGLRLIAHGKTNPIPNSTARYEYSVQANPRLVADVLAEKRERSMIQEANFRRFS